MIKPIRDNILVKPEAQSEKTRSGIIIPYARLDANNNAELVRAEVIAVGEGVWNNKGELQKPSVNIGDIILFGGRNYTGVVYEEDGIKYRLIKSVDVLFKVEDENS